MPWVLSRNREKILFFRDQERNSTRRWTVFYQGEFVSPGLRFSEAWPPGEPGQIYLDIAWQ